MHVDALRRMPELIERGIEIQVNTAWDAFGEVLLSQHSRNVQQNGRAPRNFLQFVIRQSHGLLCALQEKTTSTFKAKALDNIQEVSGAFRKFEIVRKR